MSSAIFYLIGTFSFYDIRHNRTRQTWKMCGMRWEAEQKCEWTQEEDRAELRGRAPTIAFACFSLCQGWPCHSVTSWSDHMHLPSDSQSHVNGRGNIKQPVSHWADTVKENTSFFLTKTSQTTIHWVSSVHLPASPVTRRHRQPLQLCFCEPVLV